MKVGSRSNQGFSLLELVIVVVIIGVIGAIAIPRLSAFGANAETAAIAEHLQRLETAFQLYRQKEQAWPGDQGGGVVPPEMVSAGYLSHRDFNGSPLGGKYDWEQWGDPPKQAGGYFVSVSNVTDWDGALEVDKLIDDGDLDTGAVFNYSNKWLLLTLER